MESSYSKIHKEIQVTHQKIPNANLADFAQAAYDPKDDFEGYDLSKKYSSPDRAVWVAQDRSHAILAFRGTNPKNLRDVGTDALLGAELSGFSSRFQNAENITKQLIKDFGKEGVIVTGHSLGGSQALHVSKKYGVYAEAYNPFVQLSQAEESESFPNAVVHWNVGDPVGIGIPFIKTKKTRYHYNWDATIKPIGPFPIPLAIGGLAQHGISNLVSKNRIHKKPKQIPRPTEIPRPTKIQKPGQVISYKPSVTTFKRGKKKPQEFFGLNELIFT